MNYLRTKNDKMYQTSISGSILYLFVYILTLSSLKSHIVVQYTITIVDKIVEKCE